MPKKPHTAAGVTAERSPLTLVAPEPESRRADVERNKAREKAERQKRKRERKGTGNPRGPYHTTGNKCTPARIALICKSVSENGANKAEAAAVGGISPDTLNSWLEMGETDGIEPYISFAKKFRAAELELKMQLKGTITKAALNGDWRAASRTLALRWPEEYNEKVLQQNVLAIDMRAAGEQARSDVYERLMEMARQALPPGDDDYDDADLVVVPEPVPTPDV